MKKRLFAVTIFGLLVSGFSLLAENNENTQKPAVAKVASYIEGIVDMKVQVGQHVKKGQLLFHIEADILKAVMEKCKNSVWYYNETYKRMKDLSSKHSESVENLQESEYDVVNAIGNLQKEELLLDDWSDYKAPFEGVVTNIFYYTGSAVPDASSDPKNEQAVLEVMKTADYNKMKAAGLIKEAPIVANVASMIDGLVEMNVDLGNKVKAGQVLFTINVDYNKITRKQQLANYKLTKAKYERQKKLYKQNANALKDYQLAEFNYRNAIQDLKMSDIIIDKRSVYKAPFDGVISNITYYTGSNTFAGHTVLQVTKK